MKPISLDTVIIITERSKRTWWRRIAKNVVIPLPSDSRGRTILDFDEIYPHIRIPVSNAEKELILLADTGNADAQNELGQLFLAAQKPKVAVYWLRAAAEQGNVDAMQHLGCCYAGGKGLPKDSHLALMWISKAAAGGHIIASSQIAELLPFQVS